MPIRCGRVLENLFRLCHLQSPGRPFAREERIVFFHRGPSAAPPGRRVMGLAPHDTKTIATASEGGHVGCITEDVLRLVDVGPQLNATVILSSSRKRHERSVLVHVGSRRRGWSVYCTLYLGGIFKTSQASLRLYDCFQPFGRSGLLVVLFFRWSVFQRRQLHTRGVPKGRRPRCCRGDRRHGSCTSDDHGGPGEGC